MFDSYAYGNWPIVISLILLALFFIAKYIPAKTKPQKRSSNVLIAFIIALFAEMYGFPLTIYLLSSFFGLKIPLTHEYGHLFAYLLTYLGVNIMIGWFIVMAVSTILIIIGISWIIKGWSLVYHSKNKLVTTGIYSKIRHPQYSGIMLIAIGFLIQWPTLVTIIIFPFLIIMYYKLAKKEEKNAEEKYKSVYLRYKQRVPGFIPNIRLVQQENLKNKSS